MRVICMNSRNSTMTSTASLISQNYFNGPSYMNKKIRKTKMEYVFICQRFSKLLDRLKK